MVDKPEIYVVAITNVTDVIRYLFRIHGDYVLSQLPSSS